MKRRMVAYFLCVVVMDRLFPISTSEYGDKCLNLHAK